MKNPDLETLFNKLLVSKPSEKDIKNIKDYPDRDELIEFLIGKLNDFLCIEKPPENSEEVESPVIVACYFLGRFQTEVAIVPLIEVLDRVKDFVESSLYRASVGALTEIGPAVLGLVYEKYLDNHADGFSALGWLEILSSLGVHDLRIKTAIFEYYTLNPPLAIQLMAHYGDKYFLPLIENYVKDVAEMLNENKIDPYSTYNTSDDLLIRNYMDSRESLLLLRNKPKDFDYPAGVEMLDRQYLKHSAFGPYVGGNKPVRNPATRVGRNDPCPCGSGKKYKDCHGTK